MNRIVNTISGRMSLRPPQRKSLEILDRLYEISPFSKATEVAAALDVIKSEYPSVMDFEREFPSLCFALATGVGKTRLMGAFISYLHLAHNISHFFVLAPNLTIYNKLTADFTPNTSKYVFKGIAEFAQNPPEIITGDNYESGRGVRGDKLFEAGIHVNIFNISKINSEVRGGKAPRMKRLQEYIGQSYFSYLSSLDDLVLIMDESHRYRGSAGVRVLNELKPILGLELTATPQTEAGRTQVPFKNVIYKYTLSDAMRDGFVKEPAVATRQNFRAEDYTQDGLEKIKLEDGVRIHEDTKVELEVYAGQHDRPKVKPFMLVVARDVAHAESLVAKIQADDFFEGRYKDRVITVHSNQTGDEKDDTIEKLLSVESPANPTEIVVHVNMLKEGWDVTNLYTIVPLRTADSRTLVEQSIGRGLRLPYGHRVGISPVDRLTIVAHDRFKEIIDEANRPGSPIHFKEVVVGRDVGMERKVTVDVPSNLEAAITGGVAPSPATTAAPTEAGKAVASTARPAATAFTTPREKAIANAALKAIHDLEREPDRVPNTARLSTPEIQQAITQRVTETLPVQQGELAFPEEEKPVDVAAVVAKVTELVINNTISIPRIVVVPKGEVTITFSPFKLDTGSVSQQPVDQKILIQHLRTNLREFLDSGEALVEEERMEDYLVRGLVDYDDIAYDDQADLLYDLAGQVVQKLESYLPDDEAAQNVLLYNQSKYVQLIHNQMQAHRVEQVAAYEAKASKGFETPRSVPFSAPAMEHVRDFRVKPEPLSDIPKMLFGGFKRCLYQVQKFSSDPERRFAVLLEDEPQPLKWFKPARDQFKIFYRGGEAYEPDFVVETATAKYLCEPKRADDINDADVQAKARAAFEWCQHASQHEAANGGKPWTYLLIPHDAIVPSANLQGLVANYTYQPKATSPARSQAPA